jgi:hypothetical protein
VTTCLRVEPVVCYDARDLALERDLPARIERELRQPRELLRIDRPRVRRRARAPPRGDGDRGALGLVADRTAPIPEQIRAELLGADLLAAVGELGELRELPRELALSLHEEIVGLPLELAIDELELLPEPRDPRGRGLLLRGETAPAARRGRGPPGPRPSRRCRKDPGRRSRPGGAATPAGARCCSNRAGVACPSPVARAAPRGSGRRAGSRAPAFRRARSRRSASGSPSRRRGCGSARRDRPRRRRDRGTPRAASPRARRRPHSPRRDAQLQIRDRPTAGRRRAPRHRSPRRARAAHVRPACRRPGRRRRIPSRHRSRIRRATPSCGRRALRPPCRARRSCRCGSRPCAPAVRPASRIGAPAPGRPSPRRRTGRSRRHASPPHRRPRRSGGTSRRSRSCCRPRGGARGSARCRSTSGRGDRPARGSRRRTWPSSRAWR